MRGRRRRYRVLHAPFVHFLAIGAVLFALDRVGARWAPASSSRPTVVVRSEQLAGLREAWTGERGSPPDPAEERRIVADAIDDAILHREALALGLDRDDRSVRRRLAQLGEFLGLGAGGDPPQLELAARSLGLERSDPVIAVHLADMLRLALAKTGPSDLPDEAELARYYERNAERFAQPTRLRFTHVYLALDRRGPTIDTDAARLLEELRARARPPREAAAMGDPFVHGAELGPLPVADVARLFGAAFAAAIEEVPARRWSGPLRSAYGLHLVWVDERIGARVPPLDAVRSRVVHAYLRARAQAKLRDRMKSLRARYRVEVRRATAATRESQD